MSYDSHANADVQVGVLPSWMHVSGKVAWYVYQGPYEGISEAWQTFMAKVRAARPGTIVGPPGDVYVCDPGDHQGDAQAKLTTILWAPIQE